jgi:hypothetical protein
MTKNLTPAAPGPVAPAPPADATPASNILETLVAASTGPAAPRDPALQALSGHLAGVDDEGRLLFRPEGSEQVVPVAIGLEITDGALVRAARSGRRALVLRTSDPHPRWVLAGLVRERVSAEARAAAPGELAVKVDGEVVRVEGRHQIELSCGKASLTLRADGRVVLSGVHVITKSHGAVKIKGATIALN